MSILVSKNILAEEQEIILLSQEDKDNAIVLNQDFSFTIPVVKLVGLDNNEHFYNADFQFRPKDSKLFFEVKNVTEIPQTRIIEYDSELILKIGKKINDRAFGRGCGGCHVIPSNPQLDKLIQAGELDLESFSNTLINGKNDMPKAMDAIMAVGPVKKAGFTEEQAIKAIYKFLGGNIGLEVIRVEIDELLLSQEDIDNAVILKSDFSFNLPLVKYLGLDDVEHFYNADFAVTPSDNRLLFEVIKVDYTNDFVVFYNQNIYDFMKKTLSQNDEYISLKEESNQEAIAGELGVNFVNDLEDELLKLLSTSNEDQVDIIKRKLSPFVTKKLMTGDEQQAIVSRYSNSINREFSKAEEAVILFRTIEETDFGKLMASEIQEVFDNSPCDIGYSKFSGELLGTVIGGVAGGTISINREATVGVTIGGEIGKFIGNKISLGIRRECKSITTEKN